MTKQSNAGKIVAGMGLAALAAAAAATYYFKGPSGKKHQKEMAAVAKKAKTEMLVKIKQMKTVSKKAYEQAAKEVMAKYEEAKNIDPKQIEALGKEIKSHWHSIAKTVEKAGKAAMKKPAKKKTKK